MIDTKRATEDIARLAMLKYFPADQSARAEIVILACSMAADNDQVAWLVQRCLQLWNEWEGPRELRAVFCSRYRPADGTEAYSQLRRFEDGIPSERIAEPERLQIAGRAKADELTDAESIRPVIRALGAAKIMGRPTTMPVRVPSIPVVRITDANRIMAADIERAKAERTASHD